MPSNYRLKIDHLDYLIPYGGEKIQLDSWILRPELSLSEAEAAFTERHLAYHTRRSPFDEEVVHLVLETGVLFYFVTNGEDNALSGGLHIIEFPDTYDRSGNSHKRANRKTLRT